MKFSLSFRLASLLCLGLAFSVTGSAQSSARGRAVSHLWQQVEVIRTQHGVPHIRAKDLRAAGYALAWVMCEDYGNTTPINLLSASGRRALIEGRDHLEADVAALRFRDTLTANYGRLSRDVRDVYEGFAAGVNRYIELNRQKFAANMPSDFTGEDVLATEIIRPSPQKIRNFINRLSGVPGGNSPQPTPTPAADDEGETDPNDGSNAWAFAPSRTRSGKAILLRNPHLQWTAGYYEAHVTVPGKLDFYGDFRIGSPFAVIGGFNRHLGWSTTNNSPDLDEFYALHADPARADHYLLDGRSLPLTKKVVTAKYRTGTGTAEETREFWSTPFGPVVHRTAGKIYIIKFAGHREYRAGEQFLRMMRSRSLAEWKNAMKMRGRVTSNFTYADGAGNIYFLWNASLPLLPHAVGHDLEARPAKRGADIWSRFVPFDDLPQFLNPPGGYLHNENNSPHFTNIERIIRLINKYPNFEQPELSLRAQLGLKLAVGDRKFSLEDVVRLKHDYRTLLPERVKADLIAAVRAADTSDEVSRAVTLIESWDNTTSPDSRGSTLFELWWQHYSGIRPPERNTPLPDAERFARVWSEADPFNTPRGLKDTARAVNSFVWAIAETKRRYGAVDVTWGEVHRVRRGNVDVPVGGCSNDMGCFRVLGFTRSPDGKLAANSGDCWVLAVEFTRTPRAYSVLAYGQSNQPTSPWYADQAAMFARGEMKRVAFTKKDVDTGATVRYRPGAK